MVGLWRQDIYPKFMCAVFSEKCPKAEKRSGGYRRGRETHLAFLWYWRHRNGRLVPCCPPQDTWVGQCLRCPPQGSFVPNVPPERLRGEVCLRLSQGEAFLVASPRNAVAFLTPCSVFLYKGDFALCGGRRGRCPSTLQAFEKGLSETFSGWLPKLYFSPVVLPS